MLFSFKISTLDQVEKTATKSSKCETIQKIYRKIHLESVHFYFNKKGNVIKTLIKKQKIKEPNQINALFLRKWRFD